MGDTMKAYRIVEWQHAPELTEAPVPVPGPGQVLVEVAGNGLCHSDIGMSQMPGEIGEAVGRCRSRSVTRSAAGSRCWARG
jgi:propanol-preferring alcohol dehydrogenase